MVSKGQGFSVEDVKCYEEAGDVLGGRESGRQVDPTRGGGEPLLEEVEDAGGCPPEAGG